MVYELIEQLSDDQIEDLHRLYQSEWWTKGRQLPDIRRMLQHSVDSPIVGGLFI
jgi:hypothetical protein